MKLYIMRHGETDYNREGLLQGQSDRPLNENGIRQTEAAARHYASIGLRFDRVISSPLMRAKSTASIMTGTPEKDLVTDDRLLEISFGPYEGKRYEEIDGTMAEYFKDPEKGSEPEGMERLDHLSERCRSILTELAEKFGETDEHILLTTHGMTVRALVGVINGLSWKDSWQLKVGNCRIFETEFDPVVRRYSSPVKIPVSDEASDYYGE